MQEELRSNPLSLREQTSTGFSKGLTYVRALDFAYFEKSDRLFYFGGADTVSYFNHPKAASLLTLTIIENLHQLDIEVSFNTLLQGRTLRKLPRYSFQKIGRPVSSRTSARSEARCAAWSPHFAYTRSSSLPTVSSNLVVRGPTVPIQRPAKTSAINPR